MAKQRRRARARGPASLWTVSTSNPKTGPIPTQYVGASETETRASCAGCQLAPDAGGGCYYWAGNAKRAHGSVRRSSRPRDLASALDRAPRGSRFVRFGAGGDPGRVAIDVTRAELAMVAEAGLRPIGYTHHWRDLSRDLASADLALIQRSWLASCETLEGAAEARALGWHVALAGPARAPKGFRSCPQERAPHLTCNACGLCNPARLARAGLDGITFAAHGSGRRRLPLAGAL